MKATAKVSQRQDDAGEIEYSLYVFDNVQAGRWQKHQSFAGRPEALDHARRLYRTGNYSRVEVKMTSRNPLCTRVKDQTLKVIGRRRPARGNPAVSIAVAAVFGFLTLALAYLL